MDMATESLAQQLSASLDVSGDVDMQDQAPQSTTDEPWLPSKRQKRNPPSGCLRVKSRRDPRVQTRQAPRPFTLLLEKRIRETIEHYITARASTTCPSSTSSSHRQKRLNLRRLAWIDVVRMAARKRHEYRVKQSISTMLAPRPLHSSSRTRLRQLRRASFRLFGSNSFNRSQRIPHRSTSSDSQQSGKPPIIGRLMDEPSRTCNADTNGYGRFQMLASKWNLKEDGDQGFYTPEESRSPLIPQREPGPKQFIQPQDSLGAFRAENHSGASTPGIASRSTRPICEPQSCDTSTSEANVFESEIQTEPCAKDGAQPEVVADNLAPGAAYASVPIHTSPARDARETSTSSSETSTPESPFDESSRASSATTVSSIDGDDLQNCPPPPPEYIFEEPTRSSNTSVASSVGPDELKGIPPAPPLPASNLQRGSGRASASTAPATGQGPKKDIKWSILRKVIAIECPTSSTATFVSCQRKLDTSAAISTLCDCQRSLDDFAASVHAFQSWMFQGPNGGAESDGSIAHSESRELEVPSVPTTSSSPEAAYELEVVDLSARAVPQQQDEPADQSPMSPKTAPSPASDGLFVGDQDASPQKAEEMPTLSYDAESILSRSPSICSLPLDDACQSMDPEQSHHVPEPICAEVDADLADQLESETVVPDAEASSESTTELAFTDPNVAVGNSADENELELSEALVVYNPPRSLLGSDSPHYRDGNQTASLLGGISASPLPKRTRKPLVPSLDVIASDVSPISSLSLGITMLSPVELTQGPLINRSAYSIHIPACSHELMALATRVNGLMDSDTPLASSKLLEYRSADVQLSAEETVNDAGVDQRDHLSSTSTEVSSDHTMAMDPYDSNSLPVSSDMRLADNGRSDFPASEGITSLSRSLETAPIRMPSMFSPGSSTLALSSETAVIKIPTAWFVGLETDPPQLTPSPTSPTMLTSFIPSTFGRKSYFDLFTPAAIPATTSPSPTATPAVRSLLASLKKPVQKGNDPQPQTSPSSRPSDTLPPLPSGRRSGELLPNSGLH